MAPTKRMKPPSQSPAILPLLPKPTALNLLDLPPEILSNIFKYLPFETISKTRIVSRLFNEVGSSMLNSEFQRIRLMMQQRFQNIKAQMPRRESARRKHPLARESDIVETLHMRLTLLQMTFGKHIERKHCCFFAGEILDEVYKILQYIKATSNLSRVYKVTDELFDLSTMAMEYFKEHIEPTLPEITYFAADIFDYTPSYSVASPKSQLYLMDDPTSTASSSTSTCSSSNGPSTSSNQTTLTPAVRKRLRKLKESVKKNNGQVVTLKRELKIAQRRMFIQQKQINDLKSNQEDYNKKFQGTSSKLNAVLQELSRVNTELQYWRSKSPAVHCACGKITPVTELNVEQSLPPFVFGDDPKPDLFNLAHLQDEFKPIGGVGHQPSCIAPVLVVPACHSMTPAPGEVKQPETATTLERKTVIEATFVQGPLNKPLTRACKRKLDMDHYHQDQ